MVFHKYYECLLENGYLWHRNAMFYQYRCMQDSPKTCKSKFFESGAYVLLQKGQMLMGRYGRSTDTCFPLCAEFCT